MQKESYWWYGSQPLTDGLFRDFCEFVYAYVQSDIPVLVGYWDERGPHAVNVSTEENLGHVVLAVGHDLVDELPDEIVALTQTSSTPQADELNPRLARQSDFIGSLLVQNDGRGPYQQLPLWAGDGKVECLRSRKQLLAMAAPPTDVTVNYQLARELLAASPYPRELTATVLAARDEVVDTQWIGDDGAIVGIDPRLRVRAYLLSAGHFKSLLHPPRGRRGLRPVHRNAYACADLPSHIWVWDFLLRRPDGGFDVVGEVLFDATAPASTPPDRALIASRLAQRLTIVGSNEYLDRNYDRHPEAPAIAGTLDR